MMKCLPVWKEFWDYWVQQVSVMIKLSDYLDYLYSEIIQARKRADEKSVLMAKEYAKHEYLQFFKAPRFAFPSIKMDIPLKVSDIDADTKYDFKFNSTKILKEINEKINSVNFAKNMNIPTVTLAQIENVEFNQLFKKLENRDQKFVGNVGDELKKIDFTPYIKSLQAGVFRPQDGSDKNETLEMKRILNEAILENYSVVATKLKDIYIDPNTSGVEDKEKLFINLHIEMEEEGIRITTFKDSNGQIIEEIVFE